MLGVDGGYAGARALDRGNGEAIDLADLCLRRIGRHARQAMPLESVGFREHQRACDARGIVGTGATAHQRIGQALGIAEFKIARIVCPQHADVACNA